MRHRRGAGDEPVEDTDQLRGRIGVMLQAAAPAPVSGWAKCPAHASTPPILTDCCHARKWTTGHSVPPSGGSPAANVCPRRWPWSDVELIFLDE